MFEIKQSDNQSFKISCKIKVDTDIKTGTFSFFSFLVPNHFEFDASNTPKNG